MKSALIERMLAMFTLLVLIGLFTCAWPQGVGDPILVEEFETVGCCDFRARLDVFLSELANNPRDIGLIVTVGPDDEMATKVVREEMIRSHVLLRNFDAGRLRFTRTDGQQLQTRLFRLSSDAAMTVMRGTGNTYRMELREPRRVLVDYPYGDGGLCPAIEYRDIFALFVTANPDSNVKLVLRGFRTREAKKVERELLNYFVRDVSVNRHRIQFARAMLLPGENDLGPMIEYWLLP